MPRRTRRAPFAVALCLLFGAAPPASAQTGAVTIQIDVAAGRRPISPLIYGTNFATAAQLADLNCPLNRSGGNAATRYNWQANASNRAADWVNPGMRARRYSGGSPSQTCPSCSSTLTLRCVTSKRCL